MQKREIGLKGLTLRAADESDPHTIEGLAVPFGDVIDTWDGQETFDPDCEFQGLDTAKLCYQHDELIGAIRSAEPKEDGLHITASIADTATGRDVLALLDSGALDSLSVGFIPVTDEKDQYGITHRKAVRLLETSLVSWPAYEAAKLTDHRDAENTEPPTNPTNKKEEPPMENENEEDRLAKIEEQTRSMQAAIAKLPTSAAPKAEVGGEFRSAGEYVKAFAAGDPTAIETMTEARDFIATGDSGNTTTWLADLLRLVDSRRKIANIISHAALPDKGMTLSYNAIASNGLTVSKHKEGEALPFGKITIGTESVPVTTAGGYTELSRETIDRSSVPMLDTALKALTLAYAKNTEQTLRDYLYGEIASMRDAASGANNIEASKELAKMEPYDWADLIVDAADELDARGANLVRLGVSTDVYKALIRLQTTGDRFLDISGQGVNQLGTIDVTGITGSLMRVPVQLLPGAPAATAAFIDPEAVTFWEAGGPAQLTNSDAKTLTDAYSVYGYMAVGTTFADGLLPIKFAAAAAATTAPATTPSDSGTGTEGK